MPQYTRILALGDSETYGARSTHGRTYPTYLEEQLATVHTNIPSIVINAGVNGERSWEIVDRGVQHLLDDFWIKIVLCMMGTNDSKPGSNTPIGYYMSQWDRLLRACNATDTMLVPLEIHAIDPVGQPEYDKESNDKIAEFNAAVRGWSVKNDLIYVDGIYEPFADNPRLLADGIHPTNSGNELIADRVFQTIGANPFPSVRSMSQRAGIADEWGGPPSVTTVIGSGQGDIVMNGSSAGLSVNHNIDTAVPIGGKRQRPSREAEALS